MNLANKLTLWRIVITFMFMAALLLPQIPYNYVLALVLFLIAWITDILDGAIARKYNLITSFGKLIDPLSDKILMSAAFISFVQLKEIGVPAWMVVVIVSREFLITGLRLLALNQGRVIAAGSWGKHKTTSQMFTLTLFIVVLCVMQIAPAFWNEHLAGIFPVVKYTALSITVLMTALSGVIYLQQNRDILVSE